MREMTLDEIKQTELDILKHVADFCDANGINYCLAYGTLIGAVRHKGFIPWDDDIDIWMSNEDYKRFMAMYKDEQYPFYCIENNPTYLLPFGKVVDERTRIFEKEAATYKGSGVYVDIFPLISCPENNFFRAVEGFILRLVRFQHAVSTFRIDKTQKSMYKKIMYSLAGITGKVFNTQRCVKFMLAVANAFALDSSDNLTAIQSQHIYHKSNFERFILCDFERAQFKIPAEYDKILIHIYGDYMTLPPKEQQVSNHSFVAYWKE